MMSVREYHVSLYSTSLQGAPEANNALAHHVRVCLQLLQFVVVWWNAQLWSFLISQNKSSSKMSDHSVEDDLYKVHDKHGDGTGDESNPMKKISLSPPPPPPSVDVQQTNSPEKISPVSSFEINKFLELKWFYRGKILKVMPQIFKVDPLGLLAPPLNHHHC